MELAVNKPWTIGSSYYGHNVPSVYALYRLNRLNRSKRGKNTRNFIDRIIEGIYELTYSQKCFHDKKQMK